jgi:subtilase family serine protease
MEDSGTTAPGDTAGALPGDTASALPGDTASALPGAQLACVPVSQPGSMSCSIAINVNVGSISDPQTPASLVPGLHPQDLQSAYGLGVGASPTVAIVDAYDDAAAESDLGVYRSSFGLSACTGANGCLRKIDEHGGTAYPQPNADWSEEISLDLDMISAGCPTCNILLVEANSASIDDLGTAVDTAVAQGARVISNSYYAAEWSTESGEDVHFNHPGVSMTASSGDQDWPSYPAASPYVAAVGGTTLTGSGSSWSETGWSYSGHGCSAYEARPAWQAAALTGCKVRSALDVSAVADPQHGVAMFDTQAGGWLVAGGTSVGAPIVAAAFAVAGNNALTPYIYAHARLLHQIGGTYGEYTGLGSPDGTGAF